MRLPVGPVVAGFRDMLTVVPAEGALRHKALTLLYARLPRGERERQLADLLRAVDRQEIALDDLLVAARDEDDAVGALLVVRRPGRTAFLWPPELKPGSTDDAVAERLLQAAAARMDAAGVVVTQCLLEPDDGVHRDLLNATGFPYATEILVQELDLGRHSLVPEQADGRLSLHPYDQSRHGDFVAVIERTYRETLDCPALAALRMGDDALQSYRATPDFDPRLWQIGVVDGEAIGIVLANDHRERSVREIVYLGVVPEARRCGWGRALLLDALQTAVQDERSCCEVAVDSANHHAIRLYQSLGFTELRRIAVHLRLRSHE
jgi:ribosomal protein S18 acetylase RimI-like enzyme